MKNRSIDLYRRKQCKQCDPKYFGSKHVAIGFSTTIVSPAFIGSPATTKLPSSGVDRISILLDVCGNVLCSLSLSCGTNFKQHQTKIYFYGWIKAKSKTTLFQKNFKFNILDLPWIFMFVAFGLIWFTWISISLNCTPSPQKFFTKFRQIFAFPAFPIAEKVNSTNVCHFNSMNELKILPSEFQTSI